MIKRILFGLLLIPVLGFSKGNGYDIKVRIVGLHDTIAYLGNHFGDKQYVRDTVRVNHDGWAEFKGKDTLPGGIYLIVMPNKTYFEVLVTAAEQNFTVETDTTDFVNKFDVKGSLENKLFNDHQRFIVTKTKESQALKVKLDLVKAEKDSATSHEKAIKEKMKSANAKESKVLQVKLDSLKTIMNTDSVSEKGLMEKMRALDKDVKDYRLKLMKDNPNSFMTKIFTTMREPEIPDAPKDANGKPLDSLFAYHYYKAHFWDNVDFSDERLLRTPILQNKIKQYISQLTHPLPDSIIEAVFLIIEKAKANKEVFKYCVATFANQYETSNIMGYDKIFVAIAEQYYLTDQAYWADDSLKTKIKDRVNKIKPNILGTPAHDLIMPDTSFVMHKLYDIKADYTVLVFWDPTCGHCKKEIPMLAHYYDSMKVAKQNIEVFAIGIESDLDLWKNFIKDNKLKWVNVSDLYNNTHFRDFYDIYSTPVIYLLNDKKEIIAKRLDTDKIKDFIDNQKKKEKP